MMAAPALAVGKPLGQIARLYPFTFLAFVVLGWLWISGPVVFPAEVWEGFQKWIPLYAMFLVAGFLFGGRPEPDLIRDLIFFIVGFFASAVLFVFAFGQIGVQGLAPLTQGALPALVAGNFAIAAAEESLFRGAFVRLGAKGPVVALMIIFSAVVFGLFHWVAYSMAVLGVNPIFAIMQPMIIGGAFAYLYYKTRSLALVIALHMTYNLAIIGVLAQLLGIG